VEERLDLPTNFCAPLREEPLEQRSELVLVDHFPGRAQPSLERSPHFQRGRETPFGLALERTSCNGIELGRNIGDDSGKPRNLLVQEGAQRGRMITPEKTPMREKLPQHDTSREDIGSTVELVTAEHLLGRCIREFPLEDADRGMVRVELRLGDAK